MVFSYETCSYENRGHVSKPMNSSKLFMSTWFMFLFMNWSFCPQIHETSSVLFCSVQIPPKGLFYYLFYSIVYWFMNCLFYYVVVIDNSPQRSALCAFHEAPVGRWHAPGVGNAGNGRRGHRKKRNRRTWAVPGVEETFIRSPTSLVLLVVAPRVLAINLQVTVKPISV